MGGVALVPARGTASGTTTSATSAADSASRRTRVMGRERIIAISS
jgi:hypothetical protein